MTAKLKRTGTEFTCNAWLKVCDQTAARNRKIMSCCVVCRPCCDGDPSHKKDSAWAWLVCFGAATNLAFTMGLVYGFGVLLPVFMNYFNENRERTAWIGSLSIATAFGVGPFAGSLNNRFGCRVMSMSGCITCAISLLVASFANSLVLLYISYGFLGIGSGCVLLSSLVIIRKCFNKCQIIALGIASACQGLGTMVLSQVIHLFVTAMSWRNTLRILAGSLFLNSFFSILYDPKIETGSSNEVLSDQEADEQRQTSKRFTFHCSIWKVPAFLTLVTSGPFLIFGRSTNYVHVVKFSEDLGVSSDASARLVLYMGISIVVGRFACGFVASLKCLDNWFVLQGVSLVMGVSMMLVTLAQTYEALVSYALVFGFCEGASATIFNILSMRCVDQARVASAFGYLLLIGSVMALAGPPISGFIADKGGSYKPAFLIAGGLFILASLIPFAMLCVKANERKKAKLLENERISENAEEPEERSSRKETRINGFVRRTRNSDSEEVLLMVTSV